MRVNNDQRSVFDGKNERLPTRVNLCRRITASLGGASVLGQSFDDDTIKSIVRLQKWHNIQIHDKDKHTLPP